MHTIPHEIEESQGWVLVSTEPTHALVQLRSSGRVEVYVGPDVPANTDTPLGVLLTDKELTVFSASGFTAGDKVYVRTLGINQSETVIVVGDGTITV